MHVTRVWIALGCAAMAAIGSGCGGSDSSSHFNAPQMAPIVRDATPAALRPPASASLLRVLDRALAVLSPMGTASAQSKTFLNDVIKTIFTDDYPNTSGGQAPGFINSRVLEVDGRMAEVDARGSSSGCLTNTPQAHHVDLSSISPALDITLTVQCRDQFHGSDGTTEQPGAGMVFGRQEALAQVDGGGGMLGDNYSMWLNVGGDASADHFAFWANVLDASTDDKAVDFLYLGHSPGTRIEGLRAKAQPATHRFEFVYGRDIGGADNWFDRLSCGFRMVSDGVFIWAEGTDKQMGQTCEMAAAFGLCLDANDYTDLSDTTSCDTLKTTFTMPAPTAAAMAGAGDDIDRVVQLATADDETTSF